MKRKIAVLLLVVLLFGTVSSFAITEDDFEMRMGAVSIIVSLMDPQTPVNLDLLKNYTDITLDISDGYLIQLAYGIEYGIIVGYGDGTLRPKEPITRAEFATMLYRASSYLAEYPKLGNCNIQYKDAAGWNRNALTYCVEHGFMLGYGNNVFGCSDYITVEQAYTVERRAKGGLTTTEKYQFLSYNGASPIKIDAILATANDSKYTINLSEYLIENENITLLDSFEARRDTYENFQKTFDLLYNFDYTTCNTTEQAEARVERLKDIWGSDIYGFQGITSETFLEMARQHVKKEAFFALAPKNALSSQAGTQVGFYQAKGCAYFIYYEADEGALPEGVELNKWYRQDIDFRYRQMAHVHTVEDFSLYGAIEPVPDELLN